MTKEGLSDAAPLNNQDNRTAGSLKQKRLICRIVEVGTYSIRIIRCGYTFLTDNTIHLNDPTTETHLCY